MAFVNNWPDEFSRLNNIVPTEPYKYWDIKTKGWLRLLIIEPSLDPESRIYCSLLPRPLTPDIEYEALSYTWEDGTGELGPVAMNGVAWQATEVYPITIDGGLFRPRTLWVDAICINQMDFTERGFQVAQMSSIYSMAARVIVWLGESTEQTDCGMAWLPKIATKINAACGLHRNMPLERRMKLMAAEFASFLSLPDWESGLIGIVELYLRPWWNRVWTAQEIALARRAEVQCGDKHVPWEFVTLFAIIFKVSAVIEVLYGHAPVSEKGRLLKLFVPIVHHRIETIEDVQGYMREGNINVWMAMRIVIERRCSNPRDKIYGMIGLLGDVLPFHPDYSLSKRQVYVAAFNTVLKETGDLRIFGFLSCGQSEHDQDLPSWVPDFETWNKSRCFVSIGRTYQSERQYSASPPPDLDAQFGLSFEQIDGLLYLKGVKFDTIESIGGVAPDVQELRWSNPDASHKDTILGWKALAFRSESTYPTGESLSNAFWRTVLIDRKVVDYHPRSLSLAGGGVHKARLGRADKMIPPVDGKSEKRLIRDLGSPNEGQVSHLWNRRFAVLKNGYIGLVPSVAQPGDLVSILLGGEVPYLLHLTPTGHYKVIGECYVHGIMDGEVIEGVKRGIFTYSNFVLE